VLYCCCCCVVVVLLLCCNCCMLLFMLCCCYCDVVVVFTFLVWCYIFFLKKAYILSFDVVGNKIGDAGAYAFSMALEENKTLQVLTLSGA